MNSTPEYVLVKKKFDGVAHDIVRKLLNGEFEAVYSERTLEQILQDQPELAVVSYNQYETLYREYLDQKCTLPVRISEKDYEEGIGCIPPVWRSTNGVGLCYSPELIQGTLAYWYARYNGRFFSFKEHTYADPLMLAGRVTDACKQEPL